MPIVSILTILTHLIKNQSWINQKLRDLVAGCEKKVFIAHCFMALPGFKAQLPQFAWNFFSNIFTNSEDPPMHFRARDELLLV